MIANSLPLLKQPVHKTPPKTTASKSKPAPSATSSKQQPKGNPVVEPKPEPAIETKSEPNLELVPATLLCTESELSSIEEPLPEKLPKNVPQALPGVMTESEEEEGGGTEEEEEEGVAAPVVVPVGRGRRKKGNSNKFVNIPSIEYPVSCWQGLET